MKGMILPTEVHQESPWQGHRPKRWDTLTSTVTSRSREKATAHAGQSVNAKFFMEVGRTKLRELGKLLAYIMQKPGTYQECASINRENRLEVARDGSLGASEMSKGSQKIQISRYKINKPWRYHVQHGDDSE